MPNIRLDYIWLGGYQPTANIRTKSQMLDADSFDGTLAVVPEWGFDGSSTQQAEGHETASIDRFSYGASDRGASIRYKVNHPDRRWSDISKTHP